MRNYVIVAGVIAAMATGSLFADDTSKNTPPQNMPMKSSVKKPMPTLRKVSVNGDPVDRELEVRVGPRASFLSGDTRVGANGTTFDIWNDLKFDAPSAGVQFDLDWQPVDRWHAEIGTTWDHYSHSGTTAKTITNGAAGGGPLGNLTAGSPVSADVEIYTFELTLGYDLIKNRVVRIRPYLGGKAYLADGKLTSTDSGPGGDGRTRVANTTQARGSYLVGLDNRMYISRDWYFGADIGASALPNFFNLTGDVYTGYDFNKYLGIRTGYAYDYLDYQNKDKSTMAQPLLGAVYVQAVCGF